PQPVYFICRNTYASSSSGRYKQLVVSEMTDFCRNSIAVNTGSDALEKLNSAINVEIHNTLTPVTSLADFQAYLTGMNSSGMLSGAFYSRLLPNKDYEKKSLLTIEYKLTSEQKEPYFFVVHSDYTVLMDFLDELFRQAASWDEQVLKNNLNAAELSQYQAAVSVGQELAEENEAFFREQLASIDQKIPDLKEMNSRILSLIRKLSQKGYDKSKETVFDKFKKFSAQLMNQDLVCEAAKSELLNCAEIPWTTTDEYPTLFIPTAYSDMMRKSITAISSSALSRCAMVLGDMGNNDQRGEDSEELIRKLIDKTTAANFSDLQHSEYNMMKQTRLGRMLLISLMISKDERGLGKAAEGSVKIFYGVCQMIIGAIAFGNGHPYVGVYAVFHGVCNFANGVHVLWECQEKDTWWSWAEIGAL
ncbi:MAG: hypothetical protein PHQ23_15010, partial [Candidatus Wallbacteria bacterium]|nr:hypothetical protein [Candidatus Wallbacteria bacterium]